MYFAPMASVVLTFVITIVHLGNVFSRDNITEKY
jgi:hypothetical protein